MSLVGTWKRVKVDNGMAFGKAIGATEAQLASSANAVSTVTYTITGNNVKVERCHKYDGKELVSKKFLIRIPEINPWVPIYTYSESARSGGSKDIIFNPTLKKIISEPTLTPFDLNFRKPSTKPLLDLKVNSTQWVTKSKPN